MHVARARPRRSTFAAGEELRTEISAKFRRERRRARARRRRASTSTEWWTDPAGDFALSLSFAALTTAGPSRVGTLSSLAVAYHPMTDDEVRAFLTAVPARPAILATVRADGRPHVAPVWYAVDDDGTIVFNTGETTVKGRNLRRTGHGRR